MPQDTPIGPQEPAAATIPDSRAILQALASGIGVEDLLLRHPDLTRDAVLAAFAAGAGALGGLDAREDVLPSRILDALPVNVFVKDADNRFVYVNREAEATAGASRQHIVGKTDFEVFPEQVAEELRAADEAVRTTGSPTERDEHMQCDGEVRVKRAYKMLLPSQSHNRPYLLGFSFDITAQRRVEEALRKQQRFLDLVLDTDPSCIYVKDPDGRYILANRALAKLLGRTKAEIVGKTSADLGYHPDDVEAFARTDQVVVSEQQILVGPNRFTRPDGSVGWFETTKAPLVLDDSTVHVLGISRDITEQRRSEDALEAREQELLERRRELEELTYVSSHDLQEPLRKIRLFGERVLDRCGDQMDPKGRDYLGRMMDAAARMHRLIEDLLLFSRVSRGVDVRFGAVSPGEVLRAVVRDLEVQIEEAGAELDIGPLPVLEADRSQLHRLFLNLVGNALKYRRPDVRQRITIRGEIVVHGREVWQATVADRGIGFDDSFRERIFGMFQRLHGRTEYGGSGIGLAVCRKVVELHGGTIEASGVPGEGAVFTVRLPVSQGARGAVGDPAARAEDGAR